MAAEQIIKVGIEGDAGGLDAGFAQAEKKIDQLADAVKSAEKIISPAINNISEGFKDLGNTKISTKAIADYANAIKSIKNDISGARLTSIFPQNLVPKNTVPDLKNTKKASVDATNALGNLSRVAQDAPFGFIAIANNLNPLLESFQRLSIEAKNAGQSLSSVLVSSLTGPGGIGLALGVVSAALTVASVGFGAWTRAFGGAGDEAKKAANEIKNANDVIAKSTSEFAGAFTAVKTLAIEVDLAKKGFISKDGVVKKYNETIGETIGKVKTLGEVERALAEKGDAYIKFTLLKAAANKALDKAAEGAINTQLEQTKLLKFDAAPKVNKFGDIDRRGLQVVKTLQAINKPVEEAVKKTEAEKNKFTNIAENFLTEAAEISKKFNFDFNEGKVKGDPKKIKKQIQEKLIDPISEIPFDAPDVFFAKQPEVKLAFEPNKDFAKFVSDKFQDIKIQKPPSFVFPKTTFDFSSFITFTGQQAVADKLAADLKTLGTAATDMFKSIGSEIAASLGNALAAAITGGNVQDVFKALFQLIGSSIQSLGKQMIALSPLISAISVAIKSLNPALLLPAGIAMVALGGVIKSLFSKAPGLKTGGIIPPGFPNDTFPAMLSSGEAVIPVDKLGMFGNAQPSVIILNQRLRGRDAVLQQARENKSQRRGG